jgi:hypothetical protein
MNEKKGETKLTEDFEEQKDKNVTNLWTPRVITGGKGPPGHNWLSGMKVGSVFLVKPKSSGGFALGQFHMLHKFDKACHLMDNLTGSQETHIWVDPAIFSQQFELVIVLFEPDMEDDISN